MGSSQCGTNNTVEKSRVIQQLKGCSFIRDQADGEDDSESDSEDESDGEIQNSSSGSEENGNMTEISTAAFHAAHMISAPHTPVLGVAMHEARVAGKHCASAQTDSAPSTNNPKPQVKKARGMSVVKMIRIQSSMHLSMMMMLVRMMMLMMTIRSIFLRPRD